MRKLLVILAVLFVAGISTGQDSGRGLVDHGDTSRITCSAGLEGYRVWDTALGYEVTCDGTTWVAGTGGGTLASFDIEGNPPALGFLDLGDPGTTDREGEIVVNCLTADDCAMFLAVEANDILYTPVYIFGEGDKVFDTRIGDPLGDVGAGNNYISIDETGALRTVGAATIGAQSTAPTYYFYDTDQGGVDPDVGMITCAASAAERSIMDFYVECNGSNIYPLSLDCSTGSQHVKLGYPTSSQYVDVDYQGKLSFIGASATPQMIRNFTGNGLLQSDGANCAQPTAVQLNGGPISETIICALNVGSVVYWEMKMPDNWNAGVFTVGIETLHDGGVGPAGDFDGDVIVQCRGNTEVVNNVWGAPVSLDISGYSAAFAIRGAEGLATPNCTGGCAAGDRCYFKWGMDTVNTTTAVANLHILGFTVGYTVDDLDEVD